MGIVAYHLLKNSKVTEIDIVETNEDVISLVSSLFKDEKIKIYHDNIKHPKWTKNGGYDTIILDIWVYGHDTDPDGTALRVWADMQGMIHWFNNFYPNASVFIWGLRDKNINPSVEEIPKEYFEFLRNL